MFDHVELSLEMRVVQAMCGAQQPDRDAGAHDPAVEPMHAVPDRGMSVAHLPHREPCGALLTDMADKCIEPGDHGGRGENHDTRTRVQCTHHFNILFAD